MQLIKSIEVAYFRSIYKERLDKANGTNIIFGRNDSGKSNFLRALNLFFNNETTPGQSFRFDRDFCHSRLAEAEEAQEKDIRKFVYVKVWFTTPNNWKASLGDEFWVKKQWSITRESDPLFYNSIRDSKKQQYLTRFLNNIRFHYIPAIKDRKIFEHLLGQIYSVIAHQEAFSQSLDNFSTTLQARTQELSSEIMSGLGIESAIAPPDDLTGLFHSLDFETNTSQGDSYSLTHQRGDGVLVRHIPAILAFISNRSSEDFHLWGLEEPENSLELANAIEESKSLSNYGNDKNKQIFLTSHSPALFSCKNTNVNRYFVAQNESHGVRVTSKIRTITSDEPMGPGELMGELPHLPVISDYLHEAHDKIQKIQRNGEKLANLLADRDRSIVFVEGESDRIILSAAWELFINQARPFDFEVGPGTTKLESLAKDGRVINRLAPARTVLAIVDNDEPGRSLYKTKRLDGGGRWVKHNSNGVYWCRLPFADHFIKFMSKTNIDKNFWPGCIENLFTIALRETASEEGIYELTNTPFDELLDGQRYPKIVEHISNDRPERFYLLKVIDEHKIPFANWIANRIETDPNILEPLRSVITDLNNILINTNNTN